MLDKLHDEPGRLAALERHGILDTPPEAQFDKITALVRTVLDVPMAAVSLISRDRHWMKSRQGLDLSEISRQISFCSYTIRTRGPLMVSDMTQDPVFATNPLVTGAPFIRSYLGIPIGSADGYNLGALCALDVKPRRFGSAQIDIMRGFAALVMDEMELRLIAQTDSLTGAMTRRAFLAELERSEAAATQYGEPAALLLFDIDHFKKINDDWGHPAGDAVLKAVAACCAEEIRTGDALGRIGGEEFAILLRDLAPEVATRAAERCRQTIAALAIAALPQLKVTASFGIAPLERGEASVLGWLSRADEAMYAAKQGGRNRCWVAPSGEQAV